MKFQAGVAAALAATPLAAAAPHEGGWGKKSYGLNTLAQKAGLRYFGTAIDNVSLNNTQYLSIAYNVSEFGQVTPANGEKWMFTEPQRNVFNWTMGDEIIKPAIKRGAQRRCHALVWHQQLPDWLTSQNWTKPELTSILVNHIKTEVSYYKGECYAWDVVNEAFLEDGTYRPTIFYNTIGPEYIEIAFKTAAKYDSKVKLYYNDYNMESINNKTQRVAQLVKDFKQRHIPIDGVGAQAHFTVGQAPSYDQQVANYRQFTRLGVEVAVTELDVRMELPETAEKVAQQAVDYADAVRACKDTQRCVGVTVWDFYDPFSWVPYTFEGEGNADLFWANFTRKPAYYSIADVLRS